MEEVVTDKKISLPQLPQLLLGQKSAVAGNNQTAIPAALQSDDCQYLGKAKRDEAVFFFSFTGKIKAGPKIVRNRIDNQRPGRTHALPQSFNKRSIANLPETLRQKHRQTDRRIMAGTVAGVLRHHRTGQHRVLIAPGFKTTPVHAKRKFSKKTNLQPQFHGATPDCRQLDIGLPLEILLKLYLIGLLPGELPDLFRRKIGKLDRPARPAGFVSVFDTEFFFKCGKYGKRQKRLPSSFLEQTEFRSSSSLRMQMIGVKTIPEFSQLLLFNGPDFRIITWGTVAQSG